MRVEHYQVKLEKIQFLSQTHVSQLPNANGCQPKWKQTTLNSQNKFKLKQKRLVKLNRWDVMSHWVRFNAFILVWKHRLLFGKDLSLGAHFVYNVALGNGAIDALKGWCTKISILEYLFMIIIIFSKQVRD